MWGGGRGILLQHAFLSLFLPSSSVFNTSSSPPVCTKQLTFRWWVKLYSYLPGSDFGGSVVLVVVVVVEV